MPAEEERDAAPALRRELEPARRGHVGALHLADHRAQPTMPKTLLHQGEQFVIVPCLGIEYALRRQSRLRQSRREQVASPHHPQYRPPGARGDSRHEQSHRSIVGQIGCRRRDLVQCVEPQPAARQPFVDRADSEGQSRAPAETAGLDALQCLAQLGEDLGIGHDAHDSVADIVPILFQPEQESTDWCCRLRDRPTVRPARQISCQYG